MLQRWPPKQWERVYPTNRASWPLYFSVWTPSTQQQPLTNPCCHGSQQVQTSSVVVIVESHTSAQLSVNTDLLLQDWSCGFWDDWQQIEALETCSKTHKIHLPLDLTRTKTSKWVRTERGWHLQKHFDQMTSKNNNHWYEKSLAMTDTFQWLSLDD